MLYGREYDSLNQLFGTWYSSYGTGLTLNADGTFLDMTHAREGGDEAYKGVWKIKEDGILLKFDNEEEMLLRSWENEDGHDTLWYSFFKEYDGCLMKE